MNQVKWFERKFILGTTEKIFPSILERIQGTPARLEEKINRLPIPVMKIKPDGKWSITEHVGHLIDLEPLWQGRIDDFLQKKEILRPADLENKKTENANHNIVSVADLLVSFRKIRFETIAMMGSLKENDMMLTALHPRLKIPMGIMDHFVFVAEHDDHHLARMTEIARLLA